MTRHDPSNVPGTKLRGATPKAIDRRERYIRALHADRERLRANCNSEEDADPLVASLLRKYGSLCREAAARMDRRLVILEATLEIEGSLRMA